MSSFDTDVKAITLSAEAIAGCVDLAGFPADQQTTAVAVAFAESSGRPANVNTSSGAYGLFQILKSAHPDMIKTPDDGLWVDPLQNAQWAYQIYKAKGNWSPWAAHSSGAYLLYMPQASVGVSAWQYDTRGKSAAEKKAFLDQVIGKHDLAYLVGYAYELSGGFNQIAGAAGSVQDSLNQAAGAAGQFQTATGNATVEAVASIPAIKQISGLLSWVSTPANWMHIAFVVVGGALVIGGLMAVSKPAVEGVSKLTPTGALASAVKKG